MFEYKAVVAERLFHHGLYLLVIFDNQDGRRFVQHGPLPSLARYEQLPAKPALDHLPAVADILDRLLHRNKKPTKQQSLVSDFVILSASYPRSILLSSSAGLLLARHPLSPFSPSKAAAVYWSSCRGPPRDRCTKK